MLTLLKSAKLYTVYKVNELKRREKQGYSLQVEFSTQKPKLYNHFTASQVHSVCAVISLYLSLVCFSNAN